MKKFIAILVLGLIIFSETANAKRTKWVTGNIYQDEVTKTIYEDLSNILKTKKLKITSKYNVRGGLYTTCIEGSL